MAQDIREIVKRSRPTKLELPVGHEQRFAQKLNVAFETKVPKSINIKFYSLKIAAMLITFIAVGVFGYFAISNQPATQIENEAVVMGKPTQTNQYSLGDISPNLKKMEDFYLTGINVQLASLDVNQENSELVDGYMDQLNQLDIAYKDLNAELNKVGPTEATVTALIDNLKLRLDLLFKLKNKLKELKDQKNEQFETLQS